MKKKIMISPNIYNIHNILTLLLPGDIDIIFPTLISDETGFIQIKSNQKITYVVFNKHHVFLLLYNERDNIYYHLDTLGLSNDSSLQDFKFHLNAYNIKKLNFGRIQLRDYENCWMYTILIVSYLYRNKEKINLPKYIIYIKKLNYLKLNIFFNKLYHYVL